MTWVAGSLEGPFPGGKLAAPGDLDLGAAPDLEETSCVELRLEGPVQDDPEVAEGLVQDGRMVEDPAQGGRVQDDRVAAVGLDQDVPVVGVPDPGGPPSGEDPGLGAGPGAQGPCDPASPAPHPEGPSAEPET